MEFDITQEVSMLSFKKMLTGSADDSVNMNYECEKYATIYASVLK